MTDQPFSAAAARGAVDLSSLARSSGAAGAGAGAGSAGTGTSGVVVEGTDANFNNLVNKSMTVPMVIVLWSGRLPESRDFVDTLADLARSYAGRFQLVSVDVDANPGIFQAFQVQSVPVTIGVLQGQPVPLFGGVQPADQVRAVLDKLLEAAVANGITGRVDVGEPEPVEGEEEPPLPPLHQEAFDAIERGDLDGATAAYERALKENPGDEDAKLGLAQVNLLRRTAGIDLSAARRDAADNPTDVTAQTLVADLDVLGGHIEDAFVRLIDLVKATTGDERNAAREHLLELFSIVGPGDERVKKARTALMSALY
ncbi:MAG TPA: tetratricopeptide repeat protein [Segeticoccus sp.]|uniref:tetratricopeptide repeat protein n=1 Tax=Segeticoccus sp. TaxID=2706531 RepID=UPI002D7F1D6D|nr:tetratricopeptide repeat protein [Segeticoccus sp.]HET8600851.1 tetratricopeptide repeat protein [Segeticoccus sp.]